MSAPPKLSRRARAGLIEEQWSLNEITDNVINHAQSPIGGFLQITNFSREQKIIERPAGREKGFARLRTFAIDHVSFGITWCGRGNLDDGCQLSVPAECVRQFDLPWRLTVRREQARVCDDE